MNDPILVEMRERHYKEIEKQRELEKREFEISHPFLSKLRDIKNSIAIKLLTI